MRIAIPVWDDKISPVLDTASKLLIVEVEDKAESSRFEIFMDEHEITRRCLRIRGMNVDLLICGAVSQPFFRLLTAAGIHIVRDISGHPEDVLNAYLNNKVLPPEFSMPGCNRKRKKMLRSSSKPKGKRSHAVSQKHD